MEFKLEDSTTNPRRDKLERCRKADLLLIADFFDVHVPLHAKKEELKQLLMATLMERGFFPKPAPTVEFELGDFAGAPAPLQDLPLHSGMTTEDLKLTLRIREVEVRNRELEVEAMLLKVKALELERGATVPASPTPLIAATLKWPKTVWPLLLQCKFVGKAQEVCTSLSTEDRLDYDKVKATVLRAYELVPEAYRQIFRKCEKTATQTYVEFGREKGVLFDKWCQASKVKSLEDLRELVLLEEFKNRVPDKIVIYLNEQKVTSLAAAAVLADEFELTRKNVSPPQKIKSPKSARCSYTDASESRECYYCHEQGHLIAVCPILKRKESKSSKSPSLISLIQSRPALTPSVKPEQSKVDEDF
ncbi:hypothetical protein Q5P01_011748 [Channa striata]|uniref:SCAN box domain-containing protein n=1 Tax=Channa striata TaxID=64152 RepID=A0AA88MUY8_CHASR|nr:hypothetical protein Q5P01_011748 [Channa striata]